MSAAKQALSVVFLALFVYFLPYFVLIFNSFTPFKIVHGQAWKQFMDLRRSFRAATDPVPLPEIDYKDLTYEKFMEMTNELARPIVVRNALPVANLQKLADLNWWTKNYGNSTINCVEMSSERYKACSINEFVDYNIKQKRNIYSRTNHQVLYENPEMLDMLKNTITNWIGKEPLYEIFIGFKDGGSPLHAAFGVNLFKQITGRKKWTLWNPTELPWMDLHLSDDAASLLAIGKRITFTDAEWLKKTRRYEVIVNPGDMLFNPSMWMHIVENMPGDDPNYLVIGSPERHFGLKFGWKTSWFITSHLIAKKLLIRLYQKVNGITAQKSALDFLPVKDATSAAAFDNYIRGRAIELVGAELN